jgi:hypothetical protein
MVLTMALPSPGESGEVLGVFIVSGVLFVILAGVGLMLYRRSKK